MLETLTKQYDDFSIDSVNLLTSFLHVCARAKALSRSRGLRLFHEDAVDVPRIGEPRQVNHELFCTHFTVLKLIMSHSRTL